MNKLFKFICCVLPMSFTADMTWRERRWGTDITWPQCPMTFRQKHVILEFRGKRSISAVAEKWSLKRLARLDLLLHNPSSVPVLPQSDKL
jgi:hypothetical protein